MMKTIAAMLLILLVGCQASQNPVVTKASQPQPCLPSEGLPHSGVVRPKVETINQSPQQFSWGSTHHADCPEDMRTVVPSFHEAEKAGAFNNDYTEWLSQNEYCIPDGLAHSKKGRR